MRLSERGTSSARVFERGPDDVLKIGGLGGCGHGMGLGEFFLGGEVVPEEGDAEGAVAAGKGALEPFGIIDVGGDHLWRPDWRGIWLCRN